MLLLEHKSLFEISLLEKLSLVRDSWIRWDVENALFFTRFIRSELEFFNEFHIKFPYGLT